MYSKPWRLVATAAILCTVAGVVILRIDAGRLPASPQQPKKFKTKAIVAGAGAALQMTLSSRENTAIVHATYDCPDVPYDCHYWWIVQFRRRADNVGSGPEMQYDHQSFVVKANRPRRVTFDDAFEVGPGRYNVLVGVREVSPIVDQHGNEVEAAPLHGAASAWVVVP
jgi:hypothetical protein